MYSSGFRPLNRFLILYGFACLLTVQSRAQSISHCRVIPGPAADANTTRYMKSFLPEFIDSADTGDLLNILYENGYLEASFEWFAGDTACQVQVTPGEPYSWLNLSQGNLPDLLLHEVNYNLSLFNNRIFRFRMLTRFYTRVIQWSENNGYPFAAIGLKRISIRDRGIEAELDYQPGPRIEFDTLSVIGTRRISPKFLAAYTGILPGHLYDRSRVQEIPNQLRQLQGLTQSAFPDEYFINGKCYERLFLKDKVTNGFDGYLGFLPNENSPGKILVTGQLNLKLNNLFRSGKSFMLNWQRPNLLTQELTMKYDHPCLFNSPLGLSAEFNIYKQDTSFLNTDFGMEFYFRKTRFGKLGITAGFFTSRNLLSGSSESSGGEKLADMNTAYYGLTHSYNRVDNPDFPAAGWITDASAEVGNKKILSSIGITPVSGPGTHFIFKGIASVTKFTRTGRTSTLLTKISGGYISNKNIFFNELYRLGGLGTIRGFNEKYFYASQYLYGNLEYRLRIEEKSFLLIFTDMAWIGNAPSVVAKNDFPIGMGAGFNLGTPIGNLALIYALGRDSEHNFDLRFSKIHIGYLSRF